MVKSALCFFSNPGEVKRWPVGGCMANMYLIRGETGQCGCTPTSYPSYQPAYQPNYVSSAYYSPGPIAGYILRPVGPAPNAGYAVPGGSETCHFVLSLAACNIAT
ncbi:hypothetical protein OSTOST_10566, partial [Ostertagia ostertagi]